jgi:prepilin-type N-terminal cleavage/methylation domain-containing protein
MRSLHRHPQRGFTLVELVVVMILIGVLAAVAVPSFNGVSGFAARGARDTVVSTLRYAQQSAIAMRRNVCVSLGTTLLTVTYASATGNGQACDAANALIDPSTGQAFGAASNTLPGGATLDAVSSVAFDATGRPMASVGSYLSTALSITVTGNSSPITVEPESGLVR